MDETISFAEIFSEIDFSENENGTPNTRDFTSAFGSTGPSHASRQNHHMISSAEANRSALLKVMNWWGRQDGRNLGDYYDHNDYRTNGISLSTDAETAHAEGLALHGSENGTHTKYSEELIRPYLRNLDRDFRVSLEIRFRELRDSGLDRNAAIAGITVPGLRCQFTKST